MFVLNSLYAAKEIFGLFSIAQNVSYACKSLLFLCSQNKVQRKIDSKTWGLLFSKFHKISSHGRNLISLKHQYIWTNSVVLAVFVDQIKNWLLQAYYKVKKTPFWLFLNQFEYIQCTLGQTPTWIKCLLMILGEWKGRYLREATAHQVNKDPPYSWPCFSEKLDWAAAAANTFCILYFLRIHNHY